MSHIPVVRNGKRVRLTKAGAADILGEERHNPFGYPMARKIGGPRKRRTREHVIADQSLNHLERFIIEAGHVAQRMGSDYGYDLVMFTFDERGYSEPDLVFFQLKAGESLVLVGSEYVFDLDVRDYNRWTEEKMLVVLILFDASRRRAYWLPVQDYFGSDEARLPKKGAKTVRVRVPTRQIVNLRGIAKIRELKRGDCRPARGEK